MGRRPVGIARWSSTGFARIKCLEALQHDTECHRRDVVVAVAVDVDGARAPAAAAPAGAAGVRGGGVEAVEGTCAGDGGAPACAGVEVLAETGTDVVLGGGLVRGKPLIYRVSDIDSKR